MFYLLGAIVLWLVSPALLRQFVAWKRQSEAQRSFAIRFTAFSWLLAFIFVLALIFLPNKGRVLMLVPIFLAGMTLARWWQSARERLRRRAEEESGFARARRIN